MIDHSNRLQCCSSFSLISLGSAPFRSTFTLFYSIFTPLYSILLCPPSTCQVIETGGASVYAFCDANCNGVCNGGPAAATQQVTFELSHLDPGTTRSGARSLRTILYCCSIHSVCFMFILVAQLFHFQVYYSLLCCTV